VTFNQLYTWSLYFDLCVLCCI